MSNNLLEQWDDYVESMGSVMGEVEHMAQRMADRIVELEASLTDYVHIDRLREVECRLKKAIEIADELAYAHGKWIADIDYEEFYSWREDLVDD